MLYASKYEYRLTVYSTSHSATPAAREQVVVTGKRDYRDFREVTWKVPAIAFAHPESEMDARVHVKLEMVFEDDVAAVFDWTMKRQTYPYSRLAICMKPLYGIADQGKFDECASGLPFAHPRPWACR